MKKKKICCLQSNFSPSHQKSSCNFDISAFSTVSPESSLRRKTWINQCKKICEKFKMSYLSWLHYETSFSLLCFIGEKSFLATNYFQFWFDQLSTPRLVSTSIHVPVRSYFWLHYNTTVFILLANVERCTAELKLERYKRRREIHIAMRPTLVPSWFAWTKHCKSTHLCDSTIE